MWTAWTEADLADKSRLFSRAEGHWFERSESRVDQSYRREPAAKGRFASAYQSNLAEQTRALRSS
jgi:hypothetical protein